MSSRKTNDLFARFRTILSRPIWTINCSHWTKWFIKGEVKYGLRWSHDVLRMFQWCFQDDLRCPEMFSVHCSHMGHIPQGDKMSKMCSLLWPKSFTFSSFLKCTEEFWLGSFREGLPKKSSCTFGFCPNYLDPPPSPPLNLDNLYHFFERQKRRFNRHSKWLIIQISSQIKAEY